MRYFHILTLLIAFISAGPVRAQLAPLEQLHEFVSPERFPNEDWREARDRQMPEAFEYEAFAGRTVEQVDVPYREGMDTSAIPEWTKSLNELERALHTVRDEREYSHRRDPSFARRAPWLYLFDGCFVRASHVSRSLTEKGEPAPGRIFIFGKFKMKTQYSRRDWAYWWYHVASAYRHHGKTYVLDPSVEPRHPLLLDDWVKKLATRGRETRISFCDSLAYLPFHVCQGGRPNQERSFDYHMNKFLDLEWREVKNAGADPEKVLGDEPPWGLGPNLSP